MRNLKERGLAGVQLIISDAWIGAVEAAAELFPAAQWQRCGVHFYRNVFSHVPSGKVADVARMLKAIHAQEDRRSAEAKLAEVSSVRVGESRALAQRETLTIHDLTTERWALTASWSPAWQWLHRAFQDRGLPPPKIAIEANSGDSKCKRSADRSCSDSHPLISSRRRHRL